MPARHDRGRISACWWCASRPIASHCLLGTSAPGARFTRLKDTPVIKQMRPSTSSSTRPGRRTETTSSCSYPNHGHQPCTRTCTMNPSGISAASSSGVARLQLDPLGAGRDRSAALRHLQAPRKGFPSRPLPSTVGRTRVCSPVWCRPVRCLGPQAASRKSIVDPKTKVQTMSRPSTPSGIPTTPESPDRQIYRRRK